MINEPTPPSPLSPSLMFLLEFYSLLSTLSMYRREQRLRYHHPTVERVGERVDPLEGESAPRYWTVSSSARLSTVKGEGRVKKEREKERLMEILRFLFFFFFFCLPLFFRRTTVSREVALRRIEFERVLIR